MVYRRSPHLIAYWQGDACVALNYRSRKSAHLTPEILGILDAMGDWQSERALANRLGFEGSIRTLVRALVRATFAERAASPTAKAFDSWQPWNPSAGFFHFVTRNTTFGSNHDAAARRLVQKAVSQPAPAATTRRSGPQVALPAAVRETALSRLLDARRTWRVFASSPLQLDDLSELLRLSVGVRQWARAPGRGRIALKRVPSGGACHPIEAYVVARNVSRLAAGIYHYDAAAHVLTRVRRGASRRTMNRFIQSQPWYANAPALVMFTAVFGRTMWRYPSPKAYRNILLEAGHICQTFYLAATERGLAPFCTQAIAEDAIDQALGIDGVSEGVVYVAGCGNRPRKGWQLGLPALPWWTDELHQ